MQKGCEILNKTKKGKFKAKKATHQEKYPSASVMLDISKDEYAREKERTDTIESKASTFISAIIAIFTIYIPIIPFSDLVKAYSDLDKAGIISVTVILSTMVLSITFLIIAFVNLYKAYKIKAYFRVEFSNLNDLSLLTLPENEVKKGWVDHYNKILKGNAEINTEKANKVAMGLKYSILSFALLSISAIALIIVLGGV